MPALLRSLQSFAAGNVFQVHNGIGYAALRTDDQPLQINRFPGIGIADLGILGDRKVQNVGRWACPFHAAGNSSAICDGDNFVITLGSRQGYRGKNEHQ
jgi:hypothetical protein